MVKRLTKQDLLAKHICRCIKEYSPLVKVGALNSFLIFEDRVFITDNENVHLGAIHNMPLSEFDIYYKEDS